MPARPADPSSPIMKPYAPALLRLWAAAALPLHADAAARLRSLLAHVAILGMPGLPEALQGDAAMASRLALDLMHDDDDTRRDLAMTALLLRADGNGACRLILDHARAHERRRRVERHRRHDRSSGRLPNARPASAQI